MGGSPSVPKDPHIVVVGGGYGGSGLCNHLKASKANYTLIDSRDAFHHNVGSLRAMVESGFANKTLIPYHDIHGEHFKQGRVAGVNPADKSVRLESGESVSYDYLIIATGSGGPFPCKMSHKNREEAISEYDSYVEKVKASEKVVIVGGGAVGVEAAGEVATEFPDKQVTLVHGGSSLVMDNVSSKFKKKVSKALEQLKVKVIMNEQVMNLDELDENGRGTLNTDKGTEIEADLAIICTGLYVNREAYMDGLEHVTTERGSLKVDKSFRVEGYDNIFAIGDCCASGDMWVAFLAGVHATFVAKNIALKEKGKAMNSYKGHEYPVKIVLTVGRNHGYGEMKNGMAFPDFMAKGFKCKDLLSARTWKSMGQKYPK